MLAQNFKSDTDLDLTSKQHAALISVLGMLEREELVHCPATSPKVPNGFNMARVWKQTECGTVGCIAGWCQMASGDKAIFDIFGDRPVPGAALRLFMFSDERRYDVTPAQAAKGLRNYLRTGDAHWSAVLASD